jgi:hypothetical protein
MLCEVGEEEESAFLVHPGLVELLVLHVVDPVVGHRACLSKSGLFRPATRACVPRNSCGLGTLAG